MRSIYATAAAADAAPHAAAAAAAGMQSDTEGRRHLHRRQYRRRGDQRPHLHVRRLQATLLGHSGPSKPFFPRLLRFPPISQYLLEPAFGFWALECDLPSCVKSTPNSCLTPRMAQATWHERSLANEDYVFCKTVKEPNSGVLQNTCSGEVSVNSVGCHRGPSSPLSSPR